MIVFILLNCFFGGVVMMGEVRDAGRTVLLVVVVGWGKRLGNSR